MHCHDEHCGCDHHHGKEHDHKHHHHGHEAGCGCGHGGILENDELKPVQSDVLLALYQRKSMPVACFALKCSGDDGYMTMLAPVYLNAPDDSMEQVKWLGAELAELEQKNLISLDYDIRVKGYAYAEYEKSDVYRYFAETVREAVAQGHAFDTPVLELGSMALTQAGERIVDAMLA